MELRHLRYFLAVAEFGSLNRAAAHLLVAQPSLSRQIRVLEHELGKPLFDRSARGVALTAAGAALVGHARHLLAMEAATADVIGGPDGAGEVGSAGVPPGVPSGWLLAAVRHLAEVVPECALALVEASTSDQLRSLQKGELDVAIVHQPPPSGHVGHVLWSEPFGIALRRGHELAAAPQPRLADLDGLRYWSTPGARSPVSRTTSSPPRPPLACTRHGCSHGSSSTPRRRPRHSRPTRWYGSYTAQRQLRGWRWSALHDLPLALTTWVVRRSDTRRVVRSVATALAEQGEPSPDAALMRP
jgi:DNA-binding transcriptional LysR family regulator